MDFCKNNLGKCENLNCFYIIIRQSLHASVDWSVEHRLLWLCQCGNGNFWYIGDTKTKTCTLPSYAYAVLWACFSAAWLCRILGGAVITFLPQNSRVPGSIIIIYMT